MPTVIDSLIVELGLDPKGYQDGRRKVRQDFRDTEQEATRSAKSLEAAGARGAAFFGKIRNEALKLAVVFTAGMGIKDFTFNTIKSDAAVGRLSKSMGIATEELSAWQKVAERTGGTANGITSALQSIVSEFQSLQLYGTVKNPQLLAALGITASDLQDAPQALLKISERLKEITEAGDPAKAQALGQGLGFDQETISLLTRGRGAIEDLIREQRRLGVVTDEQAEKAAQLDAKWVALKQSSQNMGRALLYELLPTLQGVVEWVINLNEEIHGADWDPIVKEAGNFGDAMGELITQLDHLNDRFNNTFGNESRGLIADFIRDMAGAVREIAAVLEVIDALASGDLGAARAAANKFDAAAHRQTEDQATVRRSAEKVAKLDGLIANGERNHAHPDTIARWQQERAQAVQEGLAAKERVRTAPAPAMASGAAASGGMDDVYKTIIAEARANPGARKDVAHVILNRMKGSGLSGEAVVRYPGQFEPWMTPAGRAQMNRMATPQAMAAAKAAYDQAVAEQAAGNDMGGANHFVATGNAGRAMPGWSSTYQHIATRDGHQFYKGAFPGMRRGGGVRAAQDVQAGAGAAPAAQVTNNSRSDVNIQRVEVITRATDAQGIARDIAPALRQSTLATQGNVGLQ